MKIHELKTLDTYFDRVYSGDKTFEVRKNDRDFQTGDQVILNSWDAEAQIYTGRRLVFKITYILYGGQFGLQSGYCVMALELID